MASDALRATGCLDPEAAGARVGELFEQHARLVLGICRLLLRDPHDAEDATQQTFLSAYRSLLTGHKPREPAAWLGTIARNECRARIRDRMSEPLYLVSDGAGEAPTEQEVGRREEVAALTEALAGLPQRQREAIVLREFYGLTHEEVALALGVSASAVDALLVRARRRLQHDLRPARMASGTLALPVVLRESLAQSIPGFLSGGGSAGIASKLASLPLLAKLAGAAATVAVVGVTGSVAVHDRPSLPAAPEAAVAATPQASAPRPHGRDAIPLRSASLAVASPALGAEERADEGDGPGSDEQGEANQVAEDDEQEGAVEVGEVQGGAGDAELGESGETGANAADSGQSGSSGDAGDSSSGESSDGG